MLNGVADRDDGHHIVRMRDYFVHRQHLCLVFELLAVNLYELIKRNQFRGVSMSLIRTFVGQVRFLKRQPLLMWIKDYPPHFLVSMSLVRTFVG